MIGEPQSGPTDVKDGQLRCPLLTRDDVDLMPFAIGASHTTELGNADQIEKR